MFNVLLPETKSTLPHYTDTSGFVVCIYGSSIEHFYNEQGNETEMVVMKAENSIRGKSA